jgi:hypothetical protein
MLSDLMEAVLTEARELLPGLRQAEVYAGQFGAEGPSRGRVTAPAFFVAVLDAPPADDQPGDGRMALDARMGAYCLTSNARGAAVRGQDAMAMAVSFARRVSESASWGLAETVQAARLEGVQNLYSSAIDGQGFALWAVTWRQVVLIGESVWQGDFDMPPAPLDYPEAGDA